VNAPATVGTQGAHPQPATALGAAFRIASRSGSVAPSGRRRGRVNVAAGLVMGQSGPRDGTGWCLLDVARNR
jgi:hypothetical protein